MNEKELNKLNKLNQLHGDKEQKLLKLAIRNVIEDINHLCDWEKISFEEMLKDARNLYCMSQMNECCSVSGTIISSIKSEYNQQKQMENSKAGDLNLRYENEKKRLGFSL